MKSGQTPLYMIGIAAQLCGVHPQTLRQYERMGLVLPARVGAKNRLYSENDIDRVKQIQRLTQGLGVNLAGVEIILRLLDQMEDMRSDMEDQFTKFAQEAEKRIASLLDQPNIPLRKDETLLPIPKIDFRGKISF